MSATLAAVDLGASSGRVMAGVLRDGRFTLHETGRFPNGPVQVPTPGGGRWHWDALRLWQSVVDGLRAASHDSGPLESVGIDTWAVDYGLLDSSGALLGNPASYRCERTQGAPGRFFAALPADELYAMDGLQMQPFNTLFQLISEPGARLRVAEQLLLMPDLLGYWLTGRAVCEVTNASTTGMLDPATRRWRPEILTVLETAFDLSAGRLLAELVEPGEVVGPVSAPGLWLTNSSDAPTPLVAVGTHDTASAVLAVPARTERFAYVSCGTWSLVGLELSRPVLTEEARLANLTNELGVDGTVRFLRNVMGLWVFNEAVRTWRERRLEVNIPDLVAQAARCTPLRTVLDIDAPVFFPPGDMPLRLAELARRTGQPVPQTPGEFSRCIFDSLALAYRRAIRQAATAADHDVEVIHMVGGGTQNALLCQLTADATGKPVVAGPVEATALGNLAVQARAVGLLEGGTSELREVIRRSSDLLEYRPDRSRAALWAAAERRVAADGG